MQKIPALNYIKHKVGQLSSGGSTIDRYVNHHVQNCYMIRDLKMIQLLNKDYPNVCIVGSFPLSIAIAFEHTTTTKVTIVDDTKALDHYKNEFKELYNIDVVIKDPIFADVQSEIDNNDLIVYSDSEYQVPLEYYQHKHKDKDVLIMNTYSSFKHSKNISYSPEELLDIYPMKEVYGCGKIPFVNDYSTFYLYGILDD